MRVKLLLIFLLTMVLLGVYLAEARQSIARLSEYSQNDYVAPVVVKKNNVLAYVFAGVGVLFSFIALVLYRKARSEK